MIYLDNSATSFPKPPVVYDFMMEFYKNHGVSPGRSGFDAAIETEEMVFNTRKMLTSFFNGDDPNHLTFSYNASDTLNMVIQGLARKGDHVVTTDLEHNSVLRPLYHLEMDGIIEVSYVPFDSAGYVHPDDIKSAIKENTRFVIVNHCSNVIGTVQPIEEIGAICKEADVYFVVDASQSAGAVPIDVKQMNIDALVFTGHKCLMGPTGIGGSYIREDVPVKGTRFGGTGVRSAVKTHLNEFPYRMECGTLNLVGVAGLQAGLRWVMEQGVENIHRKEMVLWNRLKNGISDNEKVTIYCARNDKDQNPLLSINLQGFDSGDVGTLLDVDYDIACRTGLQCAPLVHVGLGTDKIHGTVRISIGPFNTEEDVDTAIEAISEISEIRRKGLQRVICS
jgi:cysteine desulfurase family protein